MFTEEDMQVVSVNLTSNGWGPNGSTAEIIIDSAHK